MKKTIFLLLSIILLISIMTSCGKKDSKTDVQTDTTTLSTTVFSDTTSETTYSTATTTAKATTTKATVTSKVTIKVTQKTTSAILINKAALKSFELSLPDDYANNLGANVIAGQTGAEPFFVFVNIDLKGMSKSTVSLKWKTTNNSSEKPVIDSFIKISESKYVGKVSFPVGYNSGHGEIKGMFIATIDGKEYNSPTYTLFYRDR